MTKQTVVDWLVSRINRTSYDKVAELIEQARQLEYQQRITDYNMGYNDAKCNHINDAENYINEQKYLNDENTTHI
jgi:hypothetical protein